MLKHQINAAVRSPAPRPFIPQPHLVNLRRPFWIGFEEPFDEVLELLAALERVGVEAVVEVGELNGHLILSIWAQGWNVELTCPSVKRGSKFKNWQMELSDRKSTILNVTKGWFQSAYF